MSKKTLPPGYQFIGIKLLQAHFELGEPIPNVKEGELQVGYRDTAGADGSKVRVVQQLTVTVTAPGDPGKVLFRTMVELEALFDGGANPNIAPTDFANNHAPAIMFPFSREWIFKLTSLSGDWPPILLPPVNIIELRKSQSQAGKSA